MQYLKRAALLPTLLSVSLGAQATGMHRCEPTDRDAWLSKAELSSMLEAQGWSVRRMKEDGGCWEVYGTNADGKRVEGVATNEDVPGEHEATARVGPRRGT